MEKIKLDKEIKIVFLTALNTGFVTPDQKKRIANYLGLTNLTLEDFYGTTKND